MFTALLNFSPFSVTLITEASVLILIGILIGRKLYQDLLGNSIARYQTHNLYGADDIYLPCANEWQINLTTEEKFIIPVNKNLDRSAKDKAKDLQTYLDTLIQLCEIYLQQHGNSHHKQQQDRFVNFLKRFQGRNIELNNKTTCYDWSDYYTEVDLAIQFAKQAFELKELLPAQWANEVRSTIKDAAKCYARYAEIRKKTLIEFNSAMMLWQEGDRRTDNGLSQQAVVIAKHKQSKQKPPFSTPFQARPYWQ